MPTVAHIPMRVLGRLAPGILPAIGLTVTALVGVSLLLPGHAVVEPHAWGAVAVAAAVFALCVHPTGREWWVRIGAVAFAVVIATLVASTGGPDSAYQDLFAILLVSSAVLKPPVHLAIDGMVLLLAAMTPLLYARTGAAYGVDLAIDVGTWLVVAVTARLLARQLMGATSELAASDHRFQLLANDVPAVVYRQTIVDGQPRLSWVNAQTQSILGLDPDDIMADPVLVSRHIPEEDRAGFRRSRADGPVREPGVVRFPFHRDDGRRIWLEDHHAPVLGDDGRPVAVLGIVFDVSARVAAEQAQADAHEHDRLAQVQLARVLAAQQGFLQGISHELRTPLTSVAGFAALLAEHGDRLSEEQREHLLARLVAATRRLTRLVEDLVDMDRLADSTDEGLDPAPHDVRTVVEHALRALDTTRHQVEVVGDHGVASVDASAVDRIVRHLVGNALRHTPAGTRVTCEVDVDDDHVRLAVQDDGPGVPPDLRGRLFDPFVQGSHATAAASPGTGIGLALTAMLARAHGGRIWLESDGGGARFVVVLRALV